jgi:hypothetical protein
MFKRETISSLWWHVLIFAVLVALAVVGRLNQPAWNVTPLAAATLFAGVYFAPAWLAALVPIAALALSNLWLKDYSSAAEMLAVYGCFLSPLLWRNWLRASPSFMRIFVSAVGCSTTFFLVTNLVVWSIRRGVAYENNLFGLGECYLAAIPFFRWMLQGDLAYCGLIFGAWAICGAFQRSGFRILPGSLPNWYQPALARLPLAARSV